MNRRLWRALTTLGLTASGLMFSFIGCDQDYGTLNGQCLEDDQNPCTIDRCSVEGISIHDAVPDSWNQACSMGLNSGRCTSGYCLLDCEANMVPCKCATDTDCPFDGACADWACIMGECIMQPLNEGMDVNMFAGDCMQEICMGGASFPINDNTDVPPDSPGDCYRNVCIEGFPNSEIDPADAPPRMNCDVFSCNAMGMIVMSKADLGTQCEGGVCNDLGACVSCLSKSDWEKCAMKYAPNTCPVPKCDGQTCIANTHCKTACVDGVCCNTTCTEECKSCSVVGMAGTCTNLANYQPDSSYSDPNMMGQQTCTVAANGALCDGMGNCLKVVGKACMVDGDCLSGKCAMPSKVCLGAKGEACTMGTSCVSGMCSNGACL